MKGNEPTQFQEITKELYSKNIDLVNANKTLELIQKLYVIMVSNYTVERVAQQFIDTIASSLGFSDGIVATVDKANSVLNVVAITQSEINKTILKVCGIHTDELKYDLKNSENYMARVFGSGKPEATQDVWRIWTPFVKQDDMSGVNTAVGSQTILVYPIVLGDKILGSFALTLVKGASELTDFEKNALSRLTTVFGIALDRVRINLELQDAQKSELEKAKELLKLKDEFVFIATHDLRTPVTAIAGYVEIISEKANDFSPDIKEDFEAIKQGSDRLKQLINDLLEVARSDSGTIEVSSKPVDVFEIVAEVIKQQEPTAAASQIVVQGRMDLQNKVVLADKAKLTEVLENLVSNAIKYNRPKGSVLISSVSNGEYLEVSISDNGFGIPKDRQEKVFQKFFRAKTEGTENVPGTGLGLFVVRMLIEKMGGSISFASEENKGTTFTFKLRKV